MGAVFLGGALGSFVGAVSTGESASLSVCVCVCGERERERERERIYLFIYPIIILSNSLFISFTCFPAYLNMHTHTHTHTNAHNRQEHTRGRERIANDDREALHGLWKDYAREQERGMGENE